MEFYCDRCHLLVRIGQEFERYWLENKSMFGNCHVQCPTDINTMFSAEDVEWLHKIGAAVGD